MFFLTNVARNNKPNTKNNLNIFYLKIITPVNQNIQQE